MLECGRAESRGRAAFLHAISLVLESLFWADARNFHNLIMVKIEQGRIDWSADFSALAESFIDKKVRQNLKTKGATGFSSGRSSSYNRGSGYSGYSRKSFGKGFSSRRPADKGKPVYSSVCRQWNYGNCTYGDRCNRWHVCWTCAEGGKLNEVHKASSHDNSSTRPKQSEQRS